MTVSEGKAALAALVKRYRGGLPLRVRVGDDAVYDVRSVAHDLLTERGEEVVLVCAEDRKAARFAEAIGRIRDQCRRAAGDADHIGLCGLKHIELIECIAAVALEGGQRLKESEP